MDKTTIIFLHRHIILIKEIAHAGGLTFKYYFTINIIILPVLLIEGSSGTNLTHVGPAESV